jgi:N-acetylglucosamine-6-phosphate deacetylase
LSATSATTRAEVVGRLILPDRVMPGRLAIEGDRIAAIEPDDAATTGPFVAPGFIDIHVHGWGGHDAMGGPAALSGMAWALARHGVTAFLPTAVTAPIASLQRFAADVRDWMRDPPRDGAQPLGSNLEGPFLSHARKGAHEPAHLRHPVDVPAADLEPLREGLRVITIAPELPGALELIAALAADGVAVSLGHSEATVAEARAGYAAGARSTTHLFNAMSGVAHRQPGLAVAALLEDEAWTELIADGHHVDAALWPLIVRLKPRERLLLVSDALALAGTAATSGSVGALRVLVHGDRVTLDDGTTLAGSVLALDTAVRNLVASGSSLVDAVVAASTAPAELLRDGDRGCLAGGRRADLVELDGDLRVRRVMLEGTWLDA